MLKKLGNTGRALLDQRVHDVVPRLAALDTIVQDHREAPKRHLGHVEHVVPAR